MLQKPVRWENGEPDPDTEQVILDEIRNAVSGRVVNLVHEIIADDRRLAWNEAYAQRGTGSTFVRARIIADDVYDRGAPVPSVVASPTRTSSSGRSQVVGDVADELDLTLE